ncbi:MAG: hypothetical protein ACU0BK_12630 [Shimia sp.]|jgi:hypothetical protein|uniref:hypothetical protein n=1 Tax=unclassified Shimia TaxID=2630038 RepID=UPI0006B52F3D|nr:MULTISPECIES: hypothetical protein [unclassified Shimia]KPA23486.1 hypothetical protein shim_00940 [Shimia sp. SK013]
MTTDYLIAIGALIGLFSIPAMLSGYADERRPTKAMAAFILAASILATGWILDPSRYSIAELPNVIVRVIAYMMHS